MDQTNRTEILVPSVFVSGVCEPMCLASEAPRKATTVDRIFSRLLALTVLLVSCLSGSLIASASAVGDGNPSVISPFDGQTVANGWTGPVQIDFSNAPTGSFRVDITCFSDYYDTVYSESLPFTYTGEQDVFSASIAAMSKASTDCSLTVNDDYNGTTAWTSFQVGAPPLPTLAISNVSVSPTTFYPRVRDGYRDSTRLAYTLNRAANVTYRVRNSSGAVVRKVGPVSTSAGSRGWSWNGRKNDGTLTSTGTFTIEASATAGGVTKSVRKQVTVATGWMTRTKSVRRYGDSGAASTSGNCSVEWDTDYGTALLDCWGGRYAKVTYGFAIPSNAYNISWAIATTRTSLDYCCDGVISKSGSRPTSSRYVLTAKVTGWRAVEVDAVRLTYTYKARI